MAAEKLRCGRCCYVVLGHHNQCLPPARQEFPFTTWFSTLHLPQISILMDVPKSWSRPTRGRGKQIPMTHRLMQPDGQPTGTLHMFHRGNAKHPALSSTYPVHIWAADVASAKKEAALRFCMCAWMPVCEWLCVSIFTQHTIVFYLELMHTCVYVYNQMGRSRSSGFCRWKERRSEAHSSAGVDTISHWELDSV